MKGFLASWRTGMKPRAIPSALHMLSSRNQASLPNHDGIANQVLYLLCIRTE